MQLIKVIEDVFKQPPIKFAPHQQSLKAWAMYCLRNKGFKVVYAQEADFAIETRGGEKVYFKVTDTPVDLDKAFGWIIWDRTSGAITVSAPRAS